MFWVRACCLSILKKQYQQSFDLEALAVVTHSIHIQEKRLEKGIV